MMNSEDSFKDAIMNSVVARITDPSGNVTKLTWSDAASLGLTNSIPSSGKRPVYKSEKGFTTDIKNAIVDAHVALDEKTGKVTVYAPDVAIKNETFKKNVSPILKNLSAAYRLNPNTKFSVANEKGENEEKSIQDIINELNAPAENEDGTTNQNSMSTLATAAVNLEIMKDGHKAVTGLDFTDDDIMRINTVAVGPEVKDNTLQLISDLPEAKWLRNIKTYNAETGTAQYKDIMENAYNKEKVSSEDMIKLWAALEDYFDRGNFKDKEEYIKNVATVRFLDATQPNMAWIRDVTENIRGFLNGIGGFATELGTAAASSISHLGRDMVKNVFGIEPQKLKTDDLYVTRGGSQYDKNMPTEKVDGKIGRLRVDRYGVVTYNEEKIEGMVDEPTSASDVMRNIFKENQAVIQKDIEYLHASEAALDQIGYTITNLAALISAGNWLSSFFTKTAGVVASTVASGKRGAEAIESAVEFGKTMYASGTMLGFGSTPEEAAMIINGLKTIYDVAAVTNKSAMFLNFINQAVSSAKATELIIGVVGESLAEAVVGDPNRLVEVLNNKEVDADTKAYLIETYIGNALGWGVGIGTSKFLIKAGDTVRGRAISINLSRRLFKIQNAVGDAFDRALLTIRGVAGDTLAKKIETLYEKGGKYAKKQANALAATQILRRMRDVIAESPSIKISGKSTEEIKKALNEIESKIFELQGAEIALNSMQRQGMDIVQGWLKDDGSGLKAAAKNFYEKAGKLADLEKGAGDLFTPTGGAVTNLTTGKTIKLFSQTTTNYIKATEKIDFINAYIAKFEHAEGITQQILDNIKKYREELPELQKMVNTFVENASADLKLAADNFIDADRKWWAKFENLRASLGLTDIEDLRWYRGSGLWGTNGELYARTTRKADMAEYVTKHQDGASNVKTYDNYDQYMAGATGDFADPMGEMQIALYDAGNKQAYRSFAKSYNSLTGSMVVKVSGEETALFNRMKKGLEKAYNDSSREFLKNMAEKVVTGGDLDDTIKKMRLKNKLTGEVAQAKWASNNAEKVLPAKLKTIDSTNAGRYVMYLNSEDTGDLWDHFYSVDVRTLLATNPEKVPEKTKRYIFGKARALGLEISEDTMKANAIAGKTPNKLVFAYDAVNTALSGTADSVDDVFENIIKRSVLSANDDVLKNEKVLEYLNEQRRLAYEARLDTFLSEIKYEYSQLQEKYDITIEELEVAGRDTIETYMEYMTKPGTAQRKAIDELCKFYGLEGDENAITYFALRAFMDNKEEFKKKLGAKIRALIEEEHPTMSTNETKKITGTLVKGITGGIEEDFKDAFLVVKELNPNAVQDTAEKINNEVRDIAKKIEGAEANRYQGNKNVIAMRNTHGKVEYYETDPLLARLVNFQYSAEKLNGLTQAIYNTNYLWTKLFRLGTTAINLKSMMSQMFRDPINMFIGGGAYKTGQQCMDDIIDVAGDDIVAWYKTYEPEALGRLQKEAAETGQDIKELVVRREMNLGKAISPASTETSMYKSLRTAKTARLNGTEDIYDDTRMDKVTRSINKVEDTLGKGNEWRETTLRNVSYSNAFSKAIKRGYSVADARTYATFVMNEATTNFTRATNHLTALKNTVPYFGSAINGSKSFFKLLSMDPVGVMGRLIGGLVIPSVALTAYSLKDEESREIYKNIKEYEKEDAIVFVLGGRIISIPVPQELSSFMAPWRQSVEGMYGANTNTFDQLVWHDILGFSPIDLSGFADLDFAKLEQSSPGFLDRIGEGIAKMWAQLAPAPLKSGLEVVTGVDPYTGKAIDKSYLDYDEDGNPIVKDYQSGVLAKNLNNMFRSWGLTSSAPVVQNILTNIIGQASVDVLDFVVSLFSEVPNGGWALGADAATLSKGEGYNPLYVIEQRLTSPLVVEAYDEAQSAWKSEVAKLYNMKAEILRSDAWKEYLEAKRSTDDPEKLKNINSSKKNLVENYFNAIKNSVTNLQKNYGAEFTAAKYATVLSLMTMEEQTLDAGSYGNYLNKESYKTARAQAIQTMINIGFPSSTSMDILGKFTADKDGNVYVKTNNPLAILQLDDPSGASLRTQSNKQHFAVIRELINDAGIYDYREKYYDDVDKAYDAKDYNKVEKLINDYNEKVLKVISPYIKQYTPESVLQGDVMDYLEDYIMVPSSFMGKGKYYSSKTGLNKQQGYARNYIKSIFNYGKNKLKWK